MPKSNLLVKIKSLPDAPGVYRYYKDNELLYVGKAKSLKKRVKSYFSFTPILAANPKNSARIIKLIELANNLEFTQTNSELDALILENSLIKQMHPKYNILLRDDKTYPYIYVDLSDKFPRFEITRKVKKDKSIKYYGPYASGAKDLLEALYLCYPLRQMRSCKKRCVFYEINRCLAPCEFSVDYDLVLKEALNALKNPKIMKKKLSEKMMLFANSENYEEAAKIRDIIKSIDNLSQNIEVDLAKDVNFDVIAVVNDDEFISSTRLVINNGKIISVLNEKIRANEGCFITQLLLSNYKEGIIPNDIFVQEKFPYLNLTAEYLSKIANHKVNIKVSNRKEIKNLIKLAENNALNNICKKEHNLVEKLKSFFNLSNHPCLIECFDNSHLQSQAIKGAMICYDLEQNEFIKQRYRTYNLSANNDYFQMKEMLIRRIVDFKELSCPDLWIIDGGATLLKLANDLLEQNDINLDVMAISKEKLNHLAHRAKGASRDLLYFKDKVYKLNTSDEILQCIQKIRDEAHRFVISNHKKAKRKQDLKSSKLEQLGISKVNIIKLLKFYGSFDKIYEASFEELVKITNKSVANKIKNNI